jgi:hypothetical protein
VAKAKTKQLTCTGYELRVKNDEDNFRLDLILQGDDGKTYTLQVNTIHDRPGLVSSIFEVIKIVWPSFAFKFTVDGNGDITEVSSF